MVPQIPASKKLIKILNLTLTMNLKRIPRQLLLNNIKIARLKSLISTGRIQKVM